MGVQGKSAIVEAKPGTCLGMSAWLAVTQDMIDQFGAATLDDDPMHIDPHWAAEKGPFGNTVGHGFLTMGLLTYLLHAALGDGPVRDPERTGYFLNLGFDRMRLVAPVSVDSRVRGKFRLSGRTLDHAGRTRLALAVEIEIEGVERPALVGTWLVLWVPPGHG